MEDRTLVVQWLIALRHGEAHGLLALDEHGSAQRSVSAEYILRSADYSSIEQQQKLYT